ncbi:hypothetical protein FVER53590_26546 [Fusarium verticillioides]|nr:hypothetical protein FVER53590_26546 [Fusarium verticillioides]
MSNFSVPDIRVEIATSVDRVSLHSHLPSHTIPPIWFRLPSVLPLPSRLGSNLFPFAPAHRLYAVAAPALLGLDIKSARSVLLLRPSSRSNYCARSLPSPLSIHEKPEPPRFAQR